MGFLIDTSILVALERSGGDVGEIREQASEASISLAAISASELLHGVHRADSARRRERRSRFVEAILDAIAVLPFDLEVARTHSQIWADARREGRLIGAHDLLIAATALTHELTVATRNARDFERVDGLNFVVW